MIFPSVNKLSVFPVILEVDQIKICFVCSFLVK